MFFWNKKLNLKLYSICFVNKNIGDAELNFIGYISSYKNTTLDREGEKCGATTNRSNQS